LVFTGFHPFEDVRMIAGDAPGQVLGVITTLIAIGYNVTISFLILGERAGTGVDCLAALGVYRKSVGLLPQPIARKLSGGPQQHLGSKARPFIAFE
jgi:hypothetical protein